MSDDEKIREVELTVARVAGGGNAGDGRYFYTFVPDITMAERPCLIRYILKDSAPTIRIHALVHSAQPGQFEKPVIDPDGQYAELSNLVSAPALINVALVVKDENHPTLSIKCDPQVINVPD